MDNSLSKIPTTNSSFIPIQGPINQPEINQTSNIINNSPLFTDFTAQFQTIAPTQEICNTARKQAYNALILTKLTGILSQLETSLKEQPSNQNLTNISVNGQTIPCESVIKNYNQLTKYLNNQNYTLPLLPDDSNNVSLLNNLPKAKKNIEIAFSKEQANLQKSLTTLNLSVSIEKDNFYPPILRIQKSPENNSITIITRRGTDTVEITYTLDLSNDDNKIDMSIQQYQGPQATIQNNLNNLKSLSTEQIIGLFLFSCIKNDKDLMTLSLQASMAVTDYINACTNLMQEMTASQAGLAGDDPNATISSSKTGEYMGTMTRLGIPTSNMYDNMNSQMLSGYISSINNQLQLATQKSTYCNQLISTTNSQSQKDFKVLSNMLQSLGSLTSTMYNNI